MTKKFLIFFAAALLLTAGLASAWTPGGSDTKAVPDGTTVVLNLPKFDGPLANLTNVWAGVSFGIFNSVVEMDNDSTSSGTGTAKVNSAFTTFTSTVTLLKSDFDSINAGDFGIAATQNFSLTPTSGDPLGQFNVTAFGDYAYHDFGTITKQDSGNIFNGVWAGYVGTGNFQITIEASYLTGATFSGSDGYFQGSTPSGQVYAGVVYEYVPEPTTITLLTIGALAFLKRKGSK